MEYMFFIKNKQTLIDKSGVYFEQEQKRHGNWFVDSTSAPNCSASEEAASSLPNERQWERLRGPSPLGEGSAATSPSPFLD